MAENINLGILIAALGGLAIGLERQWSGHASGTGARFGGIRTFTLLGILSGVSGWLWTQQLEYLAAILIIAASALVVGGYVSAARRDVDATTEVAALVVLAAGIAAGVGYWALSGALTAITTLLLVEKSYLHKLAQKFDDTDMRAAVRFGVMAVVILPLLPEGPFGGWGGIRPRALWIAVLLFSGLSFAGYIVQKALRTRLLGYPIAGMIGGLISSTAVTFTFSRLSRAHRAEGLPLAGGILGACTVLFLRVLAATAVLNAGLAMKLVPYFLLPFAAGVLMTAICIRQSKTAGKPAAPTNNPLQFWMSLQMGALFQLVLYAVYWVGQIGQGKGLLISGAVIGLTDVDALTISMARGGHGASIDVAAQALAMGILSNTALKMALALALGAGKFRWITSGGLLALGITLGASLVLFR